MQAKCDSRCSRMHLCALCQLDTLQGLTSFSQTTTLRWLSLAPTAGMQCSTTKQGKWCTVALLTC